MADQQLDVHLELNGETTLIGHTWFSQRRSGPVTTIFAYTPEYLATPGALAIDPQLNLVSGNQYVPSLPGAFQDCAPDRWGRNLIDKRHRATMTESRRRDLNEVDYLVGVSDESRQGALRFTSPGSSTFVDAGHRVPKLIRLPHLLDAADRVDDADDLAAIKDLLEAGSGSLGGARPKASVRSPDGSLLLAKFPHRDDEWDVMAWECVALDLADAAGIRVPRHELVTVAGSRRVLLLHRFDRTTPVGHRLPYISSMTALSASDGDWHDYADIADAITDIGASAASDLRELFRRAAFNVAIHNTDDHLRNHGFVAAPGGWCLAPAFDMNPNPSPTAQRVTGIAGATHIDGEPAGLAELANACRVTPADAGKILAKIGAAVAQWRKRAASCGIAPAELDRFAPIFDR